MMGQVGALGKDNKALSDAMGLYDKAISTAFKSSLIPLTGIRSEAKSRDSLCSRSS